VAGKRYIHIAAVLVIGLVALAAGCSNTVYTGVHESNKPPEVWLSSGPVEGDTTSYQVHFYWGGWDPDGEIDHFEFIVVDGNPIGFDPADTTGLDKWFITSSYDSVIRVTADENPRDWEENDLYTKYDKTHTFFIRGVDTQGKRSDVVSRSFTAWTLAPFVQLTHPEGTVRTYSNVITFRWEGRDPIDSPSNYQQPDSVRILWSQVVNHEGIYDPTFNIILDLNQNPGWYEPLWGPWIWYRAPADSGTSTILGDDEILELNLSHIFAVQAKDEAGAVTAVFKKDQNVRQFLVSPKQGPLLTITEPFLGGFKFLGTNLNPVQVELPPGIELNFCWNADASSYGGEIKSYRYGWDIQQLDDPTQWAVDPSPFIKCAAPRTWYSGVHTIYIEAVDTGNKITLGRIQVEIIPFSMERTLLWVDDWALGNTPLPNMMLPDEETHDNFWLDICSKDQQFIPTRDVFDCRSNNNIPPEMRVIGKYQNIIWTYGNSQDGALQLVIKFTPESMIGESTTVLINYLSLFLLRGGHVWTSGRSDLSAGGLSVTFLIAPEFPAALKFDHTPAQNDTSGVNCMAYRDYCISVIDKIIGTFQTGGEMPVRRLADDALSRCTLDPDDEVTAEYPGLPSDLTLSDDVTQSEMFFDPMVRGFYYVEAYDPAYWIEVRQINQQRCFHPMYRMRTRSTRSPLDRTAVALWLDKYSSVEPTGAGLPAKAARSVHFGLPLWFFRATAVDSIADVIFEEWGLTGD
jgi:hypothetical protein